MRKPPPAIWRRELAARSGTAIPHSLTDSSLRNRGLAQTSNQRAKTDSVFGSMSQNPAAVSLAEHLVEMSLGLPQSAVDGLVQVLSFLGFGIMAVIYPHQLRAPSTPNNLPDFTCHSDTSTGVAAHKWHTVQP